jgi:peptidyl-prolyl cis-trans isomerase SurA
MIGGAAMPLGGALRVALAFSPALLLAALCGAPAWAEIANRIVATVDGDPITAHELRRYAGERGLADAPGGQVLDALITEKLLEKEIKAQGISAREEEIDRYIEEVRTRNGMDENAFQQALAGKGLTVEAYRTKVRGEIEKAQLVNREIRQRVNVSPEEIRRHYDAHLADYATQERVKVRHILFAVDGGADEDTVARARAKAEEVREMVRDGRDFGDLARQFSDAPGAERGGELGTFTRGEMESQLDEVVFRLKPGEVSEPVRTSAGFLLLRLDERVAGGHRPLTEVSDKIREQLYNDALEERFEQWLSRDLRERHHVEVIN